MRSSSRFLLIAALVAVTAVSCGTKKTAPKDVDAYTEADSALVKELYSAHAAFLDSLVSLERIEDQNRLYIRYNQELRRFIARNPESLVQIEALSLTMPDGETPVFQQPVDAILFQSVYNRLNPLYPNSKRVAALGEATAWRMSQYELQTKIDAAEQIGFIDIELKDDESRPVKLSAIDGRVKMVYFWTLSDVRQLNYSRNVLLPVYEKWHGRGFEIYSISLDMDRSAWAKYVYEQKYPWVQVNDPAGPASRYVSLYNVQSLPWAVFICDGTIASPEISDAASLGRFLGTKLK